MKSPSLLPGDHQADDASKELPAKGADANTKESYIIHDPHVTKLQGHITSGLSVENVLPADNSSISSISHCKVKNSLNISIINIRSKEEIDLIMAVAADNKSLCANQAVSLSVQLIQDNNIKPIKLVEKASKMNTWNLPLYMTLIKNVTND
jgi:hypothetical protein